MMLGVALAAAVCVVGVRGCSSSDVGDVADMAVKVDTLAVGVPADTLAAESVKKPKRVKKRRKSRKSGYAAPKDTISAIPPRDYLDERV